MSAQPWIRVPLHAAVALPANSFAAHLWRQWSWPVLPACLTVLCALLYARGWIRARRLRPFELPRWRAACFFAGLLILWLSIASPLDAFDDYLLTAHMIQHFVLMSVVPPLLLLGAPTVPMLRGLPRTLVHTVVRPIVSAGWYHRVLRKLSSPALLWFLMNAAYIGWHIPAAFELTLHSEPVHDVEHLCFLFTSIAFWWYVIQPWPAQSRMPRWTVIPYLLTSDIVNTIVSAILAFSGRVLYPSYAAAPRVSSLSPLQDQVAAGCEMWVLNSVVFLVPAVVITARLLTPQRIRSLSATTAKT